MQRIRLFLGNTPRITLLLRLHLIRNFHRVGFTVELTLRCGIQLPPGGEEEEEEEDDDEVVVLAPSLIAACLIAA